MLVMLLAIFFWLLSGEDVDRAWIAADGDEHEAMRLITPNGRPQDRLRNARIYTRTIIRTGGTPAAREDIRRRGNIEYAAAAAGAQTPWLIDMILDDVFADGIIAQPALAQHQRALERAREGVFTGEVSRDEYLEQVQEWVDDGESVHDNKTSTGLRKILERARGASTEMTEVDAAREVQDYIYECDLDAPRKAAALNVLKEICSSGFNATYGADEPRILADIWARARENPNAKEAVAIALADGQRASGSIVCSTGRVGRVIAALDGVDPLMAGLSSSPAKIHRDRVFHEVHTALSNAKQRARQEGRGHIADAFDGKGNVDESSREYIDFANDLRKEIDKIIDGTGDIFRADERERLREECYVIL
jgi:hypothetical protein